MCLWGFFPIVFSLKWSLKIHWGFSNICNSVSGFLPLWDLLICSPDPSLVYAGAALSSSMKLHLCSQMHQARHFGNASLANASFLPHLLHSGPRSFLPCSFQWSSLLTHGADQEVRWDTAPQHLSPSPSTWFMLTSVVMCLTRWEEGISAVPNHVFGKSCNTCFFSGTSWRKSDIKTRQYSGMPAAGGATTR